MERSCHTAYKHVGIGILSRRVSLLALILKDIGRDTFTVQDSMKRGRIPPPPPPTTWTIKGKPQEVGAFWNMVLSQCIYCKYVRERSPSFGEIMEEENLKIYILNWYKRWRNISLSRNVSFKSRIQTWSPPREGPATEKQKHFPVAYQGHMG